MKPQISPATKAIIVPHMFGNPAQLDPLLELGIPVVEDCAQSLGAEYKSRQVGSLGGLATFSFYATKMITTGEGGMILTDDEESHTRLVELRDYDKKALFPTKYNYKMSNLQASLGLSQLSKLHGFIERRKRIASIYNAALSEHDIKLPSATADSKCVFYRYVVKLEKMDQIKEKTHIDGMICERPVFKPLHSDFAAVECPNSDEAYHHALSIPMYPGLSQEEIDYIVTKLEEILRKQG